MSFFLKNISTRGDKMLVLVMLLLMHSLGIMAQQPSIVEGPSDVTTRTGGTVVFKCRVADKTSEYMVSWFRDNQRISRNNNESLDGQHVELARYSLIGDLAMGDYSLQIRNIKTLDEGQYKCTIRRETAEIDRSSPATLNVEYPPAENSLSCIPGNVENLGVNIPISFVCTSDPGNPPASLGWSIDSEELNATIESNPGFISVTYSKNISIEDNNKILRCDMSHPLADRPRHCTVGPLNVIYKPIDVAITSDDNPNYGADIGESLFLKCTAKANPEMEFSWTVEPAPGRTLDKSFHVRDDVLLFADLTPSFNGATVTCKANNSLGTSSTSVQISVYGELPTSPPTTKSTKLTNPPPTLGQNSGNGTLTTFHIVIIVIAVAFVIIVAMLGYMALRRRKEPPVQLHVIGADDTRSIGEASIIFHSRQNTPDPERGGTFGRMQSNFSTMSYDTQSIDSATHLMHLKSLESPQSDKANPKLTGSPKRKLKEGKEGKECVDIHAQYDGSPFHRNDIVENVYDGSPKRGPMSSTPKSTLTRQPSDHTYDECTPMSAKKYTTHASQTDLTVIGKSIDESDEHEFDEDDDDADVMCHPHVSNFSVNNCNISSRKHTQV